MYNVHKYPFKYHAKTKHKISDRRLLFATNRAEQNFKSKMKRAQMG